MPRKRTNGQAPDWNRLYEMSAPQAGYFQLSQAREADYSPPLIEYYVREGRVERVGRGIFRLTHFPPSDHEDLVLTWLWSNRHGVFSHETALLLHDLSDALPANHHMTVPSAWRRRRLTVPKRVILHYADVPATDKTWKGPVPVTKPLRTVIDCTAASVQPDLLKQAISQAIRRGLFTRAEMRGELERSGRTRVGEHPGRGKK